MFVRLWLPVLILVGLIPTQRVGSVESLLDLYDRAEYDAVARQLEATDVRGLDRLDGDLENRAKAWIGAVDASGRRRRAFVAGTLALEITYALVARESWITEGRSSNHAFAPEALPRVKRLISDQAGAPDALEYAWTLAQLATWQHWNSRSRTTAGDQWLTPEPVWAVLLGKPTLFQLARTQDAFGAGGYLGEALARFPDDPRLLLARTEGIEAIETRCAVWFCHDEMTPAALDDLHRRAKVKPPDTVEPWSKMAHRIHDMAVANLAAFDRLVPVAAEFAALARAHPEVRAEASVHLGYLAIRAARPDQALAPLATAVTSDDPHVRYLAELFTGRALEALARRTDAVGAYRRALAVVPNAPSAATFLAAQLCVSDDGAEREEAFRVLQTANTVVPRPIDPWDSYWQGDVRLWSVYMERLRQALRP